MNIRLGLREWKLSGWAICVISILGGIFSSASGVEPGSGEAQSLMRGQFVLEKGSYLKPAWKAETWAKLVESTKPVQIADGAGKSERTKREETMLRFGLHEPPYANDDLPMGLRKAWSKDGREQGLQVDCLICHGGSIGGKSYVGLGNTTLDFHTFLNAMVRVEGKRPPLLAFNLNSGRGTVNAGQLSIMLFSARNADLSFRSFPMPLGANVPEQDVPAWWSLGKKSTIYIDAKTPGASARGIMQFYLGELTEDQFAAYESSFVDLLAYIKSLKPPKYPFAIDEKRAEVGKSVFEKNCSGCHGTYGEEWSYPDQLVALDVIGTDPARALGVSEKSIDHYNSSWFGKIHPVDKAVEAGYQAPALDGVWATAPYLHNGSVPTLYALLKSSERPKRFMRQPTTDFENYDKEKVGWKVRRLEMDEKPEGEDLFYKRSVYDSSRYGLGNGGHTFGDKLSEPERMAVIEYLKSL